MPQYARSLRARRDIKEALVELLRSKQLDQIGMSELARTAQVSRNTLYKHYPNIAQVYEDMVRDFSGRIFTQLAQPGLCKHDGSDGKRPFCELMRNAGPYAGVVREPRFIELLLADEATLETHPTYAKLVAAGHSSSAARELVKFHTYGCFMASQSTRDDEAWAEARCLIDAFVQGGSEALVDDGGELVRLLAEVGVGIRIVEVRVMPVAPLL